MRLSFRSFAFLPLFVASLAGLTTLHCGGATTNQGGPDGGTGSPDATLGDPRNHDAIGASTASKVDLLLAIDDSASMGDKTATLARSIEPLLKQLVAIGDLHVGVITSSLGSFGGDVCPDVGSSNTHAHLRTSGASGPVAAAAGGFLTYGPGGTSDANALVADTISLLQGVGQSGCGLEAQLESMYRFLVQPDPWASVLLDQANQAEYTGVDGELLAQRKAFLRPDSLVVVVMLTDEDDSSPDPRSVGGQGWAFSANQFPGSTVFRADGKTTTGPRATSVCQTNPASPDCTSCGFAATCDPAEDACQKIKNDPECQLNAGYWGPAEDQLNVRFHRMKERYGIDPQFPISRYVDGFTKEKVPNRDGEHTVKPRSSPGMGADVSDYIGDPNCTNPLFAASLPGGASEELCALPKGPRGKELVVFALLGGVPGKLVGENPDWQRVLGANPAAFDFAGIDPHMIQSTVPRDGLPPPSSTRGDNGNDPISGRDWITGADDLQYACTFPLQTPRVCSSADPSCDCAGSYNPPLCAPDVGTQVNGKAYPTIRELRVVQALGERGVVGSICPTGAGNDYASTMTLLAERLKPRTLE